MNIEKKIEIIIQKINLLREREVPYEPEELFSTNYGWLFSKQITNVVKFTRKGMLCSMFFEFGDILSSFSNIIFSNDFEKEMDERKLLNESDLEKFKILKEIFENEISEDEVELIDPSIIITEAEQMAFISYLVIADCSYFEVFAENLMNNVIDKLISNKVYYEEQMNYDVKKLICNINRNSHLSGYDQINNFLKNIGLKKILFKSMTSFNLGEFPKMIYELKELRNDLAHQEPLPDFSIFNEKKFSKINKYIGKYQEAIFQIEIPDFSDRNIPKKMIEIFTNLVNRLKKKLPIMSISEAITDVFATYASVVNESISLWLEIR